MADTFWTTVVLPEKPCKVVIPSENVCMITNVALAQDEGYPTSGRVVLYVSVNNGPAVAVIPFTLGKFESTLINLQFQEDDIIIFTIKGAAVPVHISGTIVGGMALHIDNGASPVESTDDEQKA